MPIPVSKILEIEMIMSLLKPKLHLCLLTIALYGCTIQENDSVQPNFDRPNVILIMTDDMGYGDLKPFGGDGSIETPNIDGLIEGGLKFTKFHTNGTVCSPTRASLMTGQYPQEAGIEGVVTAANHRDTGMSTEKYTIAELFNEAGYQTGIFGKWHLGYQPEFGPISQGFDYFRGFVSGNVDYVSHIDQEGYEDWWKQTGLKPEEGYLTDLITDHGIKFMEEVQDEPFFLYVPHGAPHYPYQGPYDPADRTVHGDFPILGSREDYDNAYKEMIESLDWNVGRIMSYLREKELLGQTMILFFSDNGSESRVGSNYPFRGFKGQVYEGGHRVPAAFYWEGVITPGVTNELVMTMDILPTMAELLNIDLTDKTQVSGKSMASLIDGSEYIDTEDERTVFWRFRERKAAKKGEWKLIIHDEEEALYDLSDDIGETIDVKSDYPEIFRELKQSLDQWEADLNEEKIRVQ